MDAESLRARVMRYFECVNTEEWAEFTTLWAEDAETRPIGGRPRQGRDDIMGYFTKLFRPWLEHDDTPTRLVVSTEDATVLAEVMFTGRTHSDREIQFEAIDVFDFADDRKIRRWSSWYDLEYVRRFLADEAE